jgi:hypothetical protein
MKPVMGCDTYSGHNTEYSINRVFITNVKGTTFFGMSESGEASKGAESATRARFS